MSDELMFFNGIDGASGNYSQPALSAAEISKLIRGEKADDGHLRELKFRHDAATESHFGVKRGVDPENLAQAGWGVIFAHDADAAIAEALGELLKHRREQASAEKPRYKEYSGADGYRPDETKDKFLARQGMGPGAANPDKVPYYLLIVGDPEKIPYRFQYQLDVTYAVGRVHFETLDEYRQYAHNVVQAETNTAPRKRRAAFFGVKNAGDKATQMSADTLVTPLASELKAEKADWEISTILSDDATKVRLKKLMGGDETPSLLFTASHGMSFPNADPRQLHHQGALLCQDWPGPLKHRGPIPEGFYFSQDDIEKDAQLSGLIAFHFACYGAGTPRLDDFAHASGERSEIAPHAFIAGLPRKLLSHPANGALAVVGHVERAWGYSFMWPGAGAQTDAFKSMLTAVMEGSRVGSAMEYFNERYADLSSSLSSELEDIKFGKIADDYELANMWTANNDARSYAIIGDPAVRLAT